MCPVTICVLTHGAYPSLALRCIESIRRHCDRALYRLVVGANDVCETTRRYLQELLRGEQVDRLCLSDENINKCPMMRRMLCGVETEFIWWFDDDSYVLDNSALRARLSISRSAPERTVMWGHQYFFGNESDFSPGNVATAFVKSASWFRNVPPPSWDTAVTPNVSETGAVCDGRWFFITGGCWFIRSAALFALDWPDRRLIKRCDDVFLGEAIRQQGWAMQDIGALGVAINAHARRGEDV